jgi:hypothetical protein
MQLTLKQDALGRIYLGGNGVEDCLIREVVLWRFQTILLPISNPCNFYSSMSSQPLMPGIWIWKPGAFIGILTDHGA